MTRLPELPEVETVRKGLEGLVIGKMIERVQVSWPRIIRTDESLEQWQHELVGQRIERVSRRGKYLIFHLSDCLLISHLRMEGKYLYYPDEDSLLPEMAKHTHVRYYFMDGSQLHYHDVRKFGRIERLRTDDLATYFLEKKLGPEPVAGEFLVENFQQQLAFIKKAIKPALLEQKLVVGLGNIYVDETLFRAGIHPAMPANRLKAEQVKLLHQKIMQVLDEAIEAGGSTIRTYKNTLGEAGSFQQTLMVYGRQDEPCVTCGTPIEKIQLAQRGTHFCPSCQVIQY